jgi:hypothetical protein
MKKRNYEKKTLDWESEEFKRLFLENTVRERKKAKYKTMDDEKFRKIVMDMTYDQLEADF